MVSTRGIKSKFTEGELVLCYEPDPAKTKVLYDSKVLEINVNKDENGKKFLEFLIHFQGWNPTWDRFVTEDYVLKDTAENRQLQKELAEKAQLTTAVKFCRGGNLYKRDRKKRRRKLSEKINESLEAKRPLLTAEAAAATPTRSHESSSESSSEEESVVLPIPDALKKLLELDYRLITQENKLVKLPVKYNVLYILESYVKECAIKEISNAQSENEKSSLRSSCANSAAQNPDKSIDNLCNKLNLCKEVVDGLRVYFDFTLKDLLLYQQEREQYNCVMSHFRQELINSDLCLPGAMNTTQTGTYSGLFQQEHHTMTIKQEIDSSPPPSILSSNSNSVVSPSQYVVLSSPGPKDTLSTSVATSATSPHAAPIGSSGGGGDADRRKSLRSHRSSISGGYELTNGSVPKPHPVVPNIKECASSATSVSSLDTSLPVNPPLAAGSTTSRPSVTSNNAPRQEALLSQIMSWKIIPQQVYRKGEQVLPSQVYGATHLTRLFVKLPELLQPTGMSDSKMEVLLQRLNAFLEYLESHKDDWFGESHYVDAENSISYNDSTLSN